MRRALLLGARGEKLLLLGGMMGGGVHGRGRKWETGKRDGGSKEAVAGERKEGGVRRERGTKRGGRYLSETEKWAGRRR